MKRELVRSNITPHELGQALAAVDFSSVPPEKRAMAVMDRVFGVMMASVTDPADLAKARAAYHDWKASQNRKLALGIPTGAHLLHLPRRTLS